GLLLRRRNGASAKKRQNRGREAHQFIIALWEESGLRLGYLRRFGRGRRRVELDVKLLELLGLDGPRSLGERIGSLLRLGEGDDLADRALAAKDRAEAVQAHAEAAVGRGAVIEGVEQEAELAVLLLVVEAHESEDLALEVGAVVADGARREFHSIEDEIV